MSATGEILSSAFLLNVYTGILKKNYGKAPIPFSHFLTTPSGTIKAVIGTDENNNRQVYIENDGNWQKVPEGTVTNDVRLVSISPSGESLYTLDNPNQDHMGIFKLHMKNFTYKNIYTDKGVDITDVELTADGRQAYALRVDDGYPSYLIINKKLDEAKIFKDLLQSFPFSKVNITSRSSDGNYYVVMVSSDIDPGSLYLFDKDKNTIKLLFKFKPETKDFKFLQSEPIQITAEDGTTINGYFTQAKSSSSESPPPLL